MELLDEEKLINLPTLQYYDNKIKKWVSDALSFSGPSTAQIVFSKKVDFPAQGNTNTLYIDIEKKSIYIWNDKLLSYEGTSFGSDLVEEEIDRAFECISENEISNLFNE